MSTPSGNPARRPLEEAAEWYVRLGDSAAGAAEQEAWRRWYEGSAESRAAWQRVEKLQGLLRTAPAQTRRTLGNAGKRRRQLLACAGALLVCALGYLAMPVPQANVEWYATRAGEQREIHLADGTQVLLGPASRLGVAFDERHRELRLENGDIRVETGHQAVPGLADQPLRVLARDGEVTPLGTRFTLHQEAAVALLAVQAHAVELRLQRTQVKLVAGQKIRFDATGAGPVEPAGPAEDAWTRGQMVVLDMPLAQFAAELARQSGRRIDCAATVAALPVSGSFLVADPERSLAGLAALLPIRVRTDAEGVVHLVAAR